MIRINNFQSFYWQFSVAFCFIISVACNNISRNDSHPEIKDADITRGKALAAMYCQSCHALPNPSMLDSRAWENGVLPAMGPRLGIFFSNGRSYRANRYDMSLGKNFYPEKPLLTDVEWQQLSAYFIATSPDTLFDKNASQRQVKQGLPLFTITRPASGNPSPATCMVKITEKDSSARLMVSDAKKEALYEYGYPLKMLDSVKTRGPVVDVTKNKEELLVCNIGILNPNNGNYGHANYLHYNQYQKLQQDTNVLLAGLQRPVQIMACDFNNDGKQDYLVCEFGYLTGALSWSENKGNGKFEKHVLRPLPGAIKAYINDYNNDGLPDIWVLFAQGEEGIFVFTNKGNGQFVQKQVMRFPPVYGSSYFEFDDFNKDGFPDIIYTCGDNADYSTILKPYHGVYIFLNDGKYNFRQQYFYHINGCYKAIARDFDNDGDLDIATISFFADYKNNPEEGFIYLENKGDNKFDPYTLPGSEIGRWLTMDAGDINGDGKIDLVLGNFTIGPSLIKSKVDWKKGPPFIILENTGRHFSK
ncbi:MAG: FG-GAP-like repeat-containing protein [Bacteroidota bacterium]|nr:FG-GAP-like repeat-containing protein [Bacteroidota bacterium]